MSIASLYPSINPSLLLDFANSKVLDPRITFTRTTTATYYDGVTTAKAEENLLVQSQTLNNSPWSVTYSSLTADTTTAPDGTSTADTLTEDTTANIFHQIYQNSSTLPAGNYTFSIYAKANTRTFVCVNIAPDSSSRRYAVIANLSTGAITTTATDNSPTGTANSITSVGNGWYRVSVSVTHTSGYIGATAALSDSGTPTFSAYALPFYTGNGTGSIYLWGAQLEQRSSATAYTATTTQAITNYIPVLQTAAAGQARFDHNPTTGESLGLLIEEARTNSLTYSAQFDNAAWVKSGNTITSNTIIAPDGTLTGDKVVPASSQTYNQNYQNKTLSTGTNYAISCYAKKGEYSYLNLGFVYSTGNYAGAQFDLNAGSVLYTRAAASGYSVVSTSITPVGNGWYFCTVVATTGLADSYINVVASNSTWTSGSPDVAIAGNGFSGIYIWGAQLEAGSFATSYIPTVASTVTRNADAASMTGTNFSSWFNNGEGTLYAEASTSAANTAKRFAQIDSGAESNRIQIAAEASGTTKNFAVVTNSSTQAYTPVSASYPVKVGAGYKVNDFGASFNGGAIQTDTSGTVPALSVMRFGAASDASENMNGCLRKVSYYPAKATSAQIVGLTT